MGRASHALRMLTKRHTSAVWELYELMEVVVDAGKKKQQKKKHTKKHKKQTSKEAIRYASCVRE